MKRYLQTVEWLYSQLPVYQRSGGAHYKIDLRKTRDLLALLGNPERSFKSIHVAGTNGKGSVCNMLASVLQEAGYKTGLYTSPHLVDFRERARINGGMIPREYVVGFVDRYRGDFVRLELSFFEMTVGLAFSYFRDEKVDVAVVEVGMGGRLDSTNTIVPELSIITNIAKDHVQFLGNTLADIAREKAGIIKAGIPVLISERQAGTEDVFKDAALNLGSEIHFAEDLVRDELPSDLQGQYQKANIRAVRAAIQIQKTFRISEAQLRKGLLNVVKNTGFAGRWQILQKNPLIICDTAHNEAGIRQVIRQWQDIPHKNLHLVWGMVNDKDIGSILPLLPNNALYYFCRPDIPRGMDVETLHRAATETGLQGKSYASVREALNAAKSAAEKDDLIFVGGSTFVVAEVV